MLLLLLGLGDIVPLDDPVGCKFVVSIVVAVAAVVDSLPFNKVLPLLLLFIDEFLFR
jgi:hypothetical protein